MFELNEFVTVFFFNYFHKTRWKLTTDFFAFHSFVLLYKVHESYSTIPFVCIRFLIQWFLLSAPNECTFVIRSCWSSEYIVIETYFTNIENRWRNNFSKNMMFFTRVWIGIIKGCKLCLSTIPVSMHSNQNVEIIDLSVSHFGNLEWWANG